MIDPVQLQRAELAPSLRQLKTIARTGPPAGEHAGSQLLAFSTATTRFVEEFEANPEIGPAALHLAAGESHTQLEALKREFDSALGQLDRLALRLDPNTPAHRESLPEDPRPEGADAN